MSTSRSVVTSGLAALLVSLSLIAVIMLSGTPPLLTTSTTSGSPSQETGMVTTATSSSSAPSTTAQASSPGQGTLSIMLTDPPRVPPGVTAVYAYYGDLSVHGPGGWSTIRAQGEIEVLGTVNVGETLASSSLPAGSYDRVSFNVASALITYNGANYTAFVQGGELAVKIAGGTLVSASTPAAAIIDIQPVVVNVGGALSPKFVLWAEAMAFPVPSGQVHPDFMVEGHRQSLAGQGWWDDDLKTANASLRLSAVALTAVSLGLTVADAGSSGTRLKMVVVSATNLQGGTTGGGSVPAVVTGSAVFTVLPNGSLIQFRPLLHVSMPYVRGENQSSVFDALLMAGYNMSAGASVRLSYSGAIALSFGLVGPTLGIAGITSGTSYWVTVIGDNAVSSAQVTAG